MKWRSTTLCLGTMALVAAACGPNPVATTGPSTTAQVVLDGKLPDEIPTVMVLVVDDADTVDAEQLRARVAQSVRGGLLGYLDLRWGSCGSPDPAEWHPGDIRLVIARPSAPDDASLLTPLDVPALAWITQTSKKEEIDAVVAGVTEALGKRLAEPGEAYRPLHAAKNAIDLVTGARAPSGQAEAAFVASLPKDRLVDVLVASTRDDGDAAPIDNLVPTQVAEPQILGPVVVGPFASSFDTCEVSPLGATRLETWSKLFSAKAYAYPCDYQNTWDSLLHPGFADCGSTCQDKPIVVSPEGVAECKVMVDQIDLTACDPARGLRDPDGKPQFVDRQGTKLRRCEVVQLSGADLTGCRHSLDCSGCASGFCVTEVPELLATWSCEAPKYPWPLRFIGGPKSAYGSWLSVTCTAGGG